MFGLKNNRNPNKTGSSADVPISSSVTPNSKISFNDPTACSPNSIYAIPGESSIARLKSSKLVGTSLLFKNTGKPKKSSLPMGHYDVIVIGAGFSGVFASQQACKELPTAKIAIIDSNGLLSPESSSQNECFKMHTGLHYIKDRETAEACLRNTVEMAHAFYDHILDKDNPLAPSRRGRHYLVNNADSPSIEHVKAECENLQRLYAELLKEFPDAEKVFGPPENLISYLEPEQYSHVASSIPFKKVGDQEESINVTLGIETPECQIDIDKFKQHFESVFVYLRDRVKLFYKHTVIRVSHAEEFLGYRVETHRFDSATNKMVKESLYTKAVINCTWQNIDGIDSHLNFQHNDSKPCTIRAKLLVKATVPASLKSMNTCIFFSGPHVSLTRVPESAANPEERVLVTYEPKTNFGHFPSGTELFRMKADSDSSEDVKKLENFKKLIARPTSEAERNEREAELNRLSQEIMDGAARYVPGLKDAKITGQGIGFVKIFAETAAGNEYLYDPYSPIHQRREDGIQQRDLGYVSFSGMKMSHSFKSAQEVVGSVHRQLIVREVLDNMIFDIMSNLSAIEKGDMDYQRRSALRYSLKAHLLSELLGSELVSMLNDSPIENLRLQLMTWSESVVQKTFKQYYDQLALHEIWIPRASASL